jgi:hypothetical protein
MPRAKRHHLVPAFFLRYFADENERVVVRDKATGLDRAPARVENVAVEGDFYTVSEEPRDRVEQEILGSKVEGPAKVALDAVFETDAPPFRMDREAIALFLAVQFVRGRQFRAFIDGVAAAQAQRKGTPSRGSTMSPEEFERRDRAAAEAILAESKTVDFKVRVMLEQAELVVPHLLERDWALLRGHNFITGDFPFTTASHTLESGFGLGIAVADFLMAPISPTRVLFLAHLPEETFDLQEQPQAEIRHAMWGVAARETYRHPMTPHPPV